MVEDDQKFSSFVKEGLSREGFAVDNVPTAEEGVLLAGENAYDVILLDIGMPGKGGYWALNTLRQSGHSELIFMLTGKGGEQDKLLGLNNGADDYIVKPFFLAEVVARIRMRMRRRKEFATKDPQITVLTAGPLELDLLKHRLTVNGNLVLITPKEFMILEYLLRHRGRVVTQNALAQAVWSLDSETWTNVVEVHINRLRKKIDQDGQPSIIQTVRGSGYLIDADGV